MQRRALVLATVLGFGSAAAQETPRTPWGHPDFQGTWTNATLTPLQRPAELGAKELYTPAELAEFEAQRRAATNADRPLRAGDVGSYQAGSRLVTDDFGLGRFSPRRADAPWRRVLYVPGNHEYDGLEFTTAQARLRQTCADLGIEWLDREQIVIGDVRFIGTTLWADFDALAAREATVTKQLAAREKAFRAANFYLRRYSTLVDSRHLLAEGQRELALDCQAWLRAALAVPFATEQDWVLETRRLREELGFIEPIDHAEGLRRTIAWERANPPARIDPADFDYAAEDAALAAG